MKKINSIPLPVIASTIPVTTKPRPICRPGYWVSKDGEEMKISEMKDSHIANCLKFMENKCKKMSEERKNSTGRDDLIYDPVRLFSAYNELQKEQKKRASKITVSTGFLYDNDEILGAKPSKKRKNTKNQIIEYPNNGDPFGDDEPL